MTQNEATERERERKEEKDKLYFRIGNMRLELRKTIRVEILES